MLLSTGEGPLSPNLSRLEAKKFRVTRVGSASQPLRVGDAHFELDFSIYHIQARESCQRNGEKDAYVVMSAKHENELKCLRKNSP